MIGVFDSGLGGLTVVKEIYKRFPVASILYLGDLARMPYGTKSKETIERYAEENVKFLIDRGATAIVIACNTASSLAYDHLKKTFPHIPIFEVVAPAADRALELTKNNKIGIIATRATVGSGVYEEKLKSMAPKTNVVSLAAPLLVPLIEEGWFDKPETKMIARRYMYPLRRHGIDTLILGCTHFPLIKNLIQHKIGKHVTIVDSAEEIVKKLTANSPSFTSHEESRFFVTDITPHWQALAEQWLGRKIKLELIKL